MSTAQLDGPPIESSPLDSSTDDFQKAQDVACAPAAPTPNAGARQTEDDSAIVRLVRAHERPPPATKPEASKSPAAPLPIAVLTNDSMFVAQMRAALDGTPTVTYISSIDEATALATDGRCSILVTDLAMTRRVLDAFANKLRARNPAVVIVVAGDRERGSAFISLQSQGVVDGFLLKPITVGATQLVMAAAMRRYRSHGTPGGMRRVRIRQRHESKHPLLVADDFESDDTVETRGTSQSRSNMPSPAAPPRRFRLRHLGLLSAIVAVVCGAAVWFGVAQRSTGIDPAAIVAKHLALANAALSSGRLLDPRDGAAHHYGTVLAVDPQNLAAQRGLDAVARALSRQTQAHMAQQRFADAAVALARLRELQPDYAELPLLESQLKVLQDARVATHTAQGTTSVPASDGKARTTDIKSGSPREHAATREHAPMQAATRTRSTRMVADNSEPRAAVDRVATEAALREDASSLRERAGADSLPSNSTSEALTASIAPLSTLRPSEVAIANPASTAIPSPPLPSLDEAQVAPESAPGLPALVKYVPPHYPSDAYARQMEGWVEISLAIAPNGDVIEPRVEAGEKRQLFARAALAAVRQWKYAPDASRTASQRSTIRVEFKLQ